MLVRFREGGTMIVIEQGRRLPGQEVPVVVTSALQTPAGCTGCARQRLEGAESRDA